MKAFHEPVPNANKTDKASMLDKIIGYVKFLQLQVKVLSMSRSGSVAAVVPLVADINSNVRAIDCTQANGGANNQTSWSSNNYSLTMMEHQTAKVMDEDMGSTMQYLQGKGLASCLSFLPSPPMTRVFRCNFSHKNQARWCFVRRAEDEDEVDFKELMKSAGRSPP